jgi:hypothetical protein
MKLRAGLVAVVTLGSLTASFSGCTRSLEMTYSPAAYRLPQSDTLRGVALGVAKFEDRRAWIDRTEPQSLAYIMQQGSWKFGLTHQGKEYIPVQDLVQSIFVDEFKRAGLEQVTVIPEVLTKDVAPAMRAAAEQQRLGYVLGGRIHVFEIVNEVGFWTVTSRRAVTLEIHLLQAGSSALALDTTVSQLDRQGEGMGVRHSTNVDRLMNTVFRQVVTSVVEQVAAKLAMEPGDVRVRFVFADR